MKNIYKTNFVSTMSVQEMVEELEKVGDKLFMIDMIDHWSKEDRDLHDELYLKKLALMEAIEEATNAK